MLVSQTHKKDQNGTTDFKILSQFSVMCETPGICDIPDLTDCVVMCPLVDIILTSGTNTFNSLVESCVCVVCDVIFRVSKKGDINIMFKELI
jgi:hypothetical protein